MRIYNIAGSFVATQKASKPQTGGVLAHGKSHFEALVNCLKQAGLVEGRKLEVRCTC
jgi:hypothetical protein